MHPSARPPKRLENGSLVLESVKAAPGIAEAIQAAVASSWPEVQQWMPWAQGEIPTVADYRTTIENWMKSWDSGNEFEYLIKNAEGELLGTCGLTTRRGAGILEIGYWVRSDMHRQGIASRAAALLTQAGIALPGVEEIRIYCDPGNVASVGIPSKLGFTYIGNEPHEPKAQAESNEHMVWVLRPEELDRSIVERVLSTGLGR